MCARNVLSRIERSEPLEKRVPFDLQRYPLRGTMRDATTVSVELEAGGKLCSWLRQKSCWTESVLMGFEQHYIIEQHHPVFSQVSEK